MIKIITGDLLDSQEKYIGNICNCVTQNSAGVAKAIFDKYPYSDSYTNRKTPDNLGNILISGIRLNNRFVINLYSQYYPVYSKYPESSLDGIKAR